MARTKHIIFRETPVLANTLKAAAYSQGMTVTDVIRRGIYLWTVETTGGDRSPARSSGRRTPGIATDN